MEYVLIVLEGIHQAQQHGSGGAATHPTHTDFYATLPSSRMGGKFGAHAPLAVAGRRQPPVDCFVLQSLAFPVKVRNWKNEGNVGRAMP